jgi:hypothetical protein
LAWQNSLKLLHDWDTIENKTQRLHSSGGMGRQRLQAFDTIKKIFIFTPERFFDNHYKTIQRSQAEEKEILLNKATEAMRQPCRKSPDS